MLTLSPAYVQPCAQGYESSAVDTELQWYVATGLLEAAVVTEGRLPPPKQAVDRALVNANLFNYDIVVQDLLWAAKLQADNRTSLFVMVNGCQPCELWWASAVNHLYAACRRMELQPAA